MNRQEAYRKLVDEDQAQAEWLRQMAEAFGRPAAIRIRFKDGRVFQRGEFTGGVPSDPLWIPHARRCDVW